MGVTAGTDSIRQQHAVQPRVDNTIARTQRDAATVHDEVRQRVVRGHINRFWIRSRMTERLHNQIGREAEARQIFQFITSHRAGGVLRTHRRHLRFAVSTWTNARHATGAANHFLRQRIAAIAFRHVFRLTENVAVRQTQGFARFGRQATANNQRNTTTCTNFIDQNVGFQFKRSQQFVGFVVTHFAFERVNVNHVAHVQVINVYLDWQCTCIFHGVKEDRGNFAAEAQAAAALVRDMRDIIAHEPQHGVGRRFT
ncbi:hypothetical protein D3C80_1245410 [compost metagenome]